jgi:spore coat polysaccharide biosynthesis protein SpsF
MTYRTVAVIQARMGSTRLPGKVLADLGGRPMLRFMIDRLRAAPVDALVVATSDLSQDDAVADVADAAGLPVVRGPEADVLGRFAAALAAHPADHVVRLTADCPLADPAIVEEAVRRHLVTEADYTSNTIVRTFPDGLDVEVVRAAALRAAIDEATRPDEREHVTPFIYRRPDRFRLAAVVTAPCLADERWTVDTPADLERVRSVVHRLGHGRFGWRDVLEVMPPVPVPAGQPVLLPAATSTPAHRQWDLVRDAETIGRVDLRVHDGAGAATLSVPPSLIDTTKVLLEERLAADAQVVELTVRA